MNTLTANIKTGHPEQAACFCPVLYKLTLFKAEAQQTIDLGFSGGRLLEQLIQGAGQIIDRETLIAHAWNDRVVGPGSLNQQIYTLRKVLGDEKERQIIQTVARRGYRFNPECLIQPAPEPSPLPVAAPPQAPAAALPAARQGKRGRWSLGMIVAVALVGNLFTTLPTQLYASLQQVGDDRVVYMDSQQPHLHKLIEHTQNLSQRILAMSDAPVELAIVGGEDDYYKIYCTAQGGKSHSINVHSEKIHAISDRQLRACMQ